MNEAALIADALVAKINALTAVQSAGVTAERAWSPYDNAEDYADTQILVIPDSMSGQRGNRVRMDYEHTIAISVGKKARTLSEQDALVDLAGEIVRALAGESLQAVGANIIDWQRIDETPVVDHTFLRTTGVLRTMTRFTYTWRSQHGTQ